MTLIVHEIKTGPVFQTFKPTKNQNVGAVRPHLYLRDFPSGTVKVQITTPDGSLVGESSAINLGAVTNSFEFHGYVTFYLNAFLKKDTSYLFKVFCEGGYVFSPAAYCGVCGDFDLKKYPRAVEPTHYALAPLDFEIWSLSNK